MDMEREAPQRTNVMIRRMEIPKWLGQDYDIQKHEIERWASSDKLLEETKYCNMWECLKKNDIVKEYAMRKVTEKIKQERVFQLKWMRNTQEQWEKRHWC